MRALLNELKSWIHYKCKRQKRYLSSMKNEDPFFFIKDWTKKISKSKLLY